MVDISSFGPRADKANMPGQHKGYLGERRKQIYDRVEEGTLDFSSDAALADKGDMFGIPKPRPKPIDLLMLKAAGVLPTRDDKIEILPSVDRTHKTGKPD